MIQNWGKNPELARRILWLGRRRADSNPVTSRTSVTPRYSECERPQLPTEGRRTVRSSCARSLASSSLPLDDVATILGWELMRVKEITCRYVTGEAIGLGMIARLQETQNRRPTVKPSVKPTTLRRGQKRSNAVRAVAGELGLEPRMTVPKTVVLPLHHSPAGPAFPLRSVRRRRSDRPNRFGMQHPLSGLFSVCAKKVEMGACGLSNPWL